VTVQLAFSAQNGFPVFFKWFESVVCCCWSFGEDLVFIIG